MKVYGKLALLVVFAVVLLTGCGKGDKNALSVFMIDNQSDPSQVYEKLQDKLQEVMGPDLKVKVSASPIYNPEKLMVEYAAGGHDIIFLPEDDMKNYAKMGGHTVLDSYFDPKKYPAGVFASNEEKEDGTTDTTEHLYGIPVRDMKFFKDQKYVPEKLYATIPISAKSVDNAVKALKALTE
ncbi:hypothetical protein [Paenibacillus sp. XY044]|uniref:hypothetical protein n=1 Tax=Paenibacillus sp. XY044 TaxID=2026089 RepID=UPI000B980844|nr:hypothetical protein [Paenibacillus sp. XY044]OZB96353.1 hypothetical protein CJP46_10675 [Paenibacillus sp. XY044]